MKDTDPTTETAAQRSDTDRSSENQLRRWLVWFFLACILLGGIVAAPGAIKLIAGRSTEWSEFSRTVMGAGLILLGALMGSFLRPRAD